MTEKIDPLPVPVVYVNSSAEIKALAGRYDGIACTSSNAAKIVASLLDQGRRIFFMPDKNLGMNTALTLGVAPEDTAVINDEETAERSAGKKIILWDGFCYVHHLYTRDDISRARENYPGCRIILHPESRPEVAAMADYAGSTSGLLNEFHTAEPGTVLVVGTEWNFVERLKKSRPDLQIEHLRPSVCAEMHRIKRKNLVSLAENLLNGNDQIGRITVPDDISRDAASTLNRMIRYTEGKERS
jgi:quinolinate synthase